MIKLMQLVDPKILVLEAEEKELPKQFKVFERGFEFLKQRVVELNKKATKYKVPPLEIVIHNEEMVKSLRPDVKKEINSGMIQLAPGALTGPGSDQYYILVKQYTLSLKGEPPHVDGYEFIARLEHTSEGNFIYTSPHSSVPNLPTEFKTAVQHCDVCHTNRDRNDTFVVKMINDDPKRFPDKKAGDLLVVGRNCLSRFMPGVSIAGLVAYTNMIEATQYDVKEAKEMDEQGEGYGGGGGKYYEPAGDLLFWLCATFIHTGHYLSKSQANKNAESGMGGPATEPTIYRALTEMRPNPFVKGDPRKIYPIYYKVKEDEGFKAKADSLAEEFLAWFPTKDWEKMAQDKADKADFIHNMALVGRQEYLKSQYFGFFSALFQYFLRDKKASEDKAEAAKKAAELPPSPINFADPSLQKKRLRDIAKEAEIKKLVAGGMDEKAIKKAIKGKVWGWEVKVKKITEYEKTMTFGYGDAGIGYRILFEDLFGNEFMWFASSDLGFVEGNKYIIDGAVISFEPPSKYHPNSSQVRINRVAIIKDIQNPDAPPAPVIAM